MEKKLITTQLIKKACQDLNIPFETVTNSKMVIQISTDTHVHYIINSNFGLLSSTTAQLCLDKGYQYEILHSVIQFPKTYSYIDPFSIHKQYSPFHSYQEIIQDIEQKLSYPMIIKKNSGTEGENVFCCNTKTALKKAITKIFNQSHYLYDHILLAQEYVPVKNEYRAIFYKEVLEILYKKDISQAQFVGNLSPLHFDNAKAIDLTDKTLFEKITRFISPIFGKIDLRYAGFDIVEDQKGNLWFLEMNAVPGYAYYLADNPAGPVLNLFKKILTDIKKGK